MADWRFEDGMVAFQEGRYQHALEIWMQMSESSGDETIRSTALNNQGALHYYLGNVSQANTCWSQAATVSTLSALVSNQAYLQAPAPTFQSEHSGARKIAVLSLLFNWPSTGGGTVHTKELLTELDRAGYEVLHLYAICPEWELGAVQEPLPYPAQGLRFAIEDWHPEEIRARFAAALQRFAPDAVIITDSWNTKSLLCEAADEYPYYIRIAAQECLCPLNNVRLRLDSQRQIQQCHLTQLQDPDDCRNCVHELGEQFSGALHQAERELGGFFESDFSDRLTAAFARSAGILAVNPEIAELCRPFAPAVHVIPSGFDPSRFPVASSQLALREPGPLRILFAGLVQEYMKGFHVLAEAGEILWQRRRDFVIQATGRDDNLVRPYLQYLGWQSQTSLPAVIQQCDLLVFPTIAQEALGRTAVEAMACGKPVVASRLGGLQWVVNDGVTGLLCEPGNTVDLATTLERLLDDPALRSRMGAAGQQKFQREFTWEAILSRHYFSLLGHPVRTPC